MDPERGSQSTPTHLSLFTFTVLLCHDCHPSRHSTGDACPPEDHHDRCISRVHGRIDPHLLVCGRLNLTHHAESEHVIIRRCVPAGPIHRVRGWEAAPTATALNALDFVGIAWSKWVCRWRLPVERRIVIVQASLLCVAGHVVQREERLASLELTNGLDRRLFPANAIQAI
jgi:hypothetical protein